jgi:hypothetical protein
MSGFICIPAVNPEARENTVLTPAVAAARPAAAKVEVFKNLRLEEFKGGWCFITFKYK